MRPLAGVSWCFIANSGLGLLPLLLPLLLQLLPVAPTLMPPFRKDPSVHLRAKLLFEHRWRPEAVAQDAHCSRTTGYRWERNIAIYGEPVIPRHLYVPTQGPRRRLSPAAREALLNYHAEKPWLYQDELITFLSEEWDIQCSQPTISKTLKQANISRKKAQRLGPQSEELRVAWQAFASQVKAEQLVFIDESLFKLQTMWRSMAYAPIGDPARYHRDMRRGDTYSILPAYTTDGYLPCTGIKKGYYNKDEIIDWLTNQLLPLCNEYPRERSVIVLDNVSVHVDPRIIEAIEQKGCIVKYLPPYSPDYNPIELTFSVLKAWMRRHFEAFRPVFQNDFEGFLRYAVINSGCDEYAREHFQYSPAGYIFDGEIEAFEREMDQWANSH